MQHNADGPHPRCWATDHLADSKAERASSVWRLHNLAKIKPARLYLVVSKRVSVPWTSPERDCVIVYLGLLLYVCSFPYFLPANDASPAVIDVLPFILNKWKCSNSRKLGVGVNRLNIIYKNKAKIVARISHLFWWAVIVEGYDI